MWKIGEHNNSFVKITVHRWSNVPSDWIGCWLLLILMLYQCSKVAHSIYQMHQHRQRARVAREKIVYGIVCHFRHSTWIIAIEMRRWTHICCSICFRRSFQRKATIIYGFSTLFSLSLPASHLIRVMARIRHTAPMHQSGHLFAQCHNRKSMFIFQRQHDLSDSHLFSLFWHSYKRTHTHRRDEFVNAAVGVYAAHKTCKYGTHLCCDWDAYTFLAHVFEGFFPRHIWWMSGTQIRTTRHQVAFVEFSCVDRTG